MSVTYALRAGQLRQRVTLQTRDTTADAYGQQVTTWTDFAASVPAEVAPLSGREFLTAGATQGEVMAKVLIRYLAGVVPAMRLLFDGDTYNIVAVLPDSTARKHLTLMVGKGLNNG